ncbi:MAG: alkaline phosphatase [Desulfosoma sp.]|uniref:alkaline phosphatase n=1 Tax=Desulfosoma sp. TaxID=2603217 RepID=UPI00404AFB95
MFGRLYKATLWARISSMLALWVILTVTPGAADAAKNLIVMVPDGTGATHTTLARWVSESQRLAIDSMHVGAVRTYGADSMVTDSAPAATAFATGHKSSDKFIGVLPGPVTIPGVPPVPEELQYKPVATVLEGAKLLGKATGLVATSNIQHATPAGFSAHWPDRNNYNEIAEQQVYQDIDVVLGGGKLYLMPASQGGKRTDGENLLNVLMKRGYTIVETRDDLLNTTADRVWGLFAPDAMQRDLDRAEFAPQEPSLAEMTKKAIEILSKNPQGFFLFVEGSEIDWSSHANDPVGVVTDYLAFDAAVQVALDFAKQHGDTVVAVFSDHGNGGMSIGNARTNKTYSKMSFDSVVQALRKAKLTAEGVAKKIGNDRSEAHIRTVVSTYWGIDDLTPEEIAAIQNYDGKHLSYALGPIMSVRSNIGWSTNGHTGEDLFFYHFGLNVPTGTVENTDLAHAMASLMGFSLADIDARLYRSAEAVAAQYGARLSIDRSDPENPVLVLRNGWTARFPFSKDILILDGHTFRLKAPTVFAPNTGKVYINLELE